MSSDIPVRTDERAQSSVAVNTTGQVGAAVDAPVASQNDLHPADSEAPGADGVAEPAGGLSATAANFGLLGAPTGRRVRARLARFNAPGSRRRSTRCSSR